MANPLTLYVPIKQDAATQAAAKIAAATFVSSVQAGLDSSQIVHYARLALIPNLSGNGIQAICLITTFDGPMNPYLQFFWNNPGTQKAFAGVAALALNPPKPPVKDLNGFERFINQNNINQPADLYQAYTQTVKQITGAPSPAAATKKAGTKASAKAGAKASAKSGAKAGAKGRAKR
jgi:hypothetical protein